MLDWLVRWLAPDAVAGAYNDWRLVSGAGHGEIIIAFGAALVVAAVALSVLGLSRLPWRRKAPVIALRAAAAVVVGALLLEPAVELRAISRVPSRVALLLDSSRSMALATPSGGTRAERVVAHLEAHAGDIERLSRQAAVEWHRFDERSRPLESRPAELPTDGRHTNLLRAVQELSWQGSGRALGAIVLYSDGADTEGLTVERAEREAKALGVPIHVVRFDDRTTAPDLAIRRIPADDFAFLHQPVVLDVELEVRGLSLGAVDVTIEQDGRLLQTRTARFENGRAHVAFEVKPKTIGRQVYRVSVPVQSGETVRSNNEKSVMLRVIRDRIRVLQVAGRPSWDQRFLRDHLKRDPNIDLISFFILRSTTDQQKASQDELALIPFPVHELFTEELETFDVVIYQNFSYRPYRMDRYLPNLRDFVRAGGGFLMIGGDQSFEDGWYAGTALAEVLPVRLGGASPWEVSPYRPRLTEAGRAHPITRIGEPGEPIDAVYQRLPELEGVNPSLGLFPGASALLSHPSLPGNPPVVALRDVGEGRSLAVTTDALWFWRFLAVRDGDSGRAYERFWSNVFRWLVHDPELERMRLRVDRSVVPLGEPVTGEVKVVGRDHQALEGGDIDVQLAPQGEGPARSVRLRTGPEGTALFRFDDIPAGAYSLRAEAFQGGQPVGERTEPVIVEAADREWQNPFPRPDLLDALAKGSGGSSVDIGGGFPEVRLEESRRVQVDRSRRVPLWDGWAAFVLLLSLVGAEWWWRRRAGLL